MLWAKSVRGRGERFSEFQKKLILVFSGDAHNTVADILSRGCCIHCKIRYSRVSTWQREKFAMNPKAVKLIAAAVMIFVLTLHALLGQDATATLSGAVTDSSGKVVANAKVSIKNLSTSQSTETQTDSAGVYTVPALATGEYEVSASVDGLGSGNA